MRDPDRTGRGFAALLLLMAVCQACLFPGALFGGETFFRRDLASFFRPMKALLAPLAEASGGMPLWNPFLASGQPFAGNPQNELFHPMTSLFFLLPFEVAFRLQVILPLLVAALSMYFLLISLRLSAQAAMLGGVAWGIGGYTLSTTNLLPILFAVAVLPAVLAFAVRHVERGDRMSLAGLALSLGLMCLAGEPSSLLMTPVLLLGALGHVAKRPGGLGLLRERAAALVGALALGIALGGVALLTGLHHASKTVRAEGLGERASLWSLPPIRLLELVFPRVLGHQDLHADPAYWGWSLYPELGHPFLHSIYPGLIVSLLAGIAVVKRFRDRWPWVATAALGVLLALGSHLPFWRWVANLSPAIRGIRYPEKFILLTVFSVTVLGSLALEDVLRRVPGHRRSLFRSLAIMGALVTVGGLAILMLDGGGALPRPPGITPRVAEGWADTVARDLFLSGGVAAIGLLALQLPLRVGALLVAITAAELVLLGRPLIPTRPVAELMTPPPFLAPLVQSRAPSLLFHYAAYHPRLSDVSGLREPPIPSQWGIATAFEPSIDLTELRWSQRATERFIEVIQTDPLLFSPLLRRRGVTAVLRFRPGLDAKVGMRLPVGPEGPLQLFLTKDPNPFSFCVSQAVAADGEEGWMEAVRRLGPAAATTAVVSREGAHPLPAELSPCRVHFLEHRPQRLLLKVDAQGPHPSFVAINQTWDEGWRLRVDGNPARLLRTDLSLSGFVLTPGSHRIELAYTDVWLAGGLVVSASALALLILIVIRARASGPRSVAG